LAGRVSEPLMDYRPRDFYHKNQVTFRPGQKAVSINVKEKSVLLESGESIAYDRLLLATGSKPSNPSLPGMEREGVYSFYTLDDAEKIAAAVGEGTKAVVLGAGLTALKAAEALVTLQVETTLVVRSRILRNFLDEGAGNQLALHLQKKGLVLHVGCEPAEIEGNRRATAVRLTDGTRLPCDLVIAAMGIEPNSEVAEGSLVQVNEGIPVDGEMRTNIPEIFAAGDVARGYDLLTGGRRVIPLLPVAYAQGETAGRNMAGENVNYIGMGMNAVSFFGLPVISAGIFEHADEVALQEDKAAPYYRKLFFTGRHLTGFILVNRVDRAGILTWLIREKVDVTPFKSHLLDGTFSLAHLPEEMRKTRLSA
jgi:NAD(P)H-nitrite reductase large subunit